MQIEIIKAKKSSIDRSNSTDLELTRVGAYCRVSTDSDDQLSSYKSQVSYYRTLIEENSKWEMVDIYADEAVTGTQTSKRESFRRMIGDCMNGDIDMIITKSISRFARNTLDTLKYVRMLKEKNIAVLFEDEKINTMTMDGELLLVVLSSVAQQEVENISANVKKGLKMKMQRGELVGYQGCLGYDYDYNNKSLSVNKEEAKIVRFIFKRYLQGIGASIIGRELETKGYKTSIGNSRWYHSTIMCIIKNEKYKGDILLGKTITVDPISKKRLANLGEEDQFYIKNHHEAIIDEESFDKAQEILNARSVNRKDYGKRKEGGRQFAFTSKLKCHYCNSSYSRRTIAGNTKKERKPVWQCITYVRRSKSFCPHSKIIHESIVENAFVEAYKHMFSKNKDILEEFIKRMNNTLKKTSVESETNKVLKEISDYTNKRRKLVDLKLEDKINDEDYDVKKKWIERKIELLENKKESLVKSQEGEELSINRIEKLRKAIDSSELLESFDRDIFESVIDKVIVGHYDEENQDFNPYKLTFVFKSGGKTSRSYGQVGENIEHEYMEIMSFKHYGKFFSFIIRDDNSREKQLITETDVSVAISVL